MVKSKQNKRTYKRVSLIEFLIVLIILFLLNYVASFVFGRYDLTSDKRFTISEKTKTYLKNLNDIVYFKVYLNDNDLPYDFQRLRNSIKENLDEFRVYAKDNIQYDFINPTESGNKKIINTIYNQLYDKGLTPANISEKSNDGSTSQKILFPGAIVTFQGKEIAVDFFKENSELTSEQNLNNSIQDLEYTLINSIHKLQVIEKPKIAFIYGHKELEEPYVADFTKSLSEYYDVDRVKINKKLHALDKYDLIIVAKPDSFVDKYDKFIIDQFIMKGGKSIWFYDPVNANLDSLAYLPYTLAQIRSTNIDDLLFNYGVRVDPNLIQDMQCAVIPINTAMQGMQPKFEPAPWIFYPLITPDGTHPINKNLNLIKCQFVSSIDTVGENNNIKKTFLLHSSKLSRIINAPARISLDILNKEPNPNFFTKQNIPIAVLLEGKFTSLFKNRLTPEIENNRDINFKKESVNTKIIVVSDGDLIKNNLRRRGANYIPYPLGYDRYTRQMFGNKDFAMNCVNYLLDDSGIMNVRKHNFKLRMLNRAKANEERLYWQLINIITPLLFIIIIGILISFLRKRKYSKKIKEQKWNLKNLYLHYW